MIHDAVTQTHMISPMHEKNCRGLPFKTNFPTTYMRSQFGPKQVAERNSLALGGGLSANIYGAEECTQRRKGCCKLQAVL